MKYVKTGRILTLIAKADEEDRPLYIQGPIGCGKTAAMEYYYRRTSHHVIDCSDGKIEPKTEASRIRAGTVVFDNVSYLNDEESIKYVLDMLKNSGKHVIFISRTPRPAWLMSESLDHNVIIADQRDMRLNKEQVFKILEEAGVDATEEQKLLVMEESKSNPLLIWCIAYYMKDKGVYDKEVNTFARINYYNYLDKELLGRLTEEEKEFLLSMCWYPNFSYELARAVNGDECLSIVDSIQRKNAYILTFSSIGIQLMDSVITYLRHKRNLLWSEEKHVSNLCRAAEYYVSQDNLLSALFCYETAHTHDKTIALLEETARTNLTGISMYILRDYYLALTDEEVRSSWYLTGAKSFVESLMIKPRESEKWFELLKKFRDQETDPDEKKAMERTVAFLDLMLPHHGAKNLKERYNRVLDHFEESCPNENEYFDLMPTLIHGSLDLTELTKNDEQFYVFCDELIHRFKGRAYTGAMDILKAEIAYERESMDHYKIFKRLNRGYMISDADNSCGGCFAAIGVSTHLHLNRGEQERAEEILDGIRTKTVQFKNDVLLGNIDALYGWVDQLHANRENVLAWLETTPDEGVGFTFFDRSIMMGKVRAYIILGRYTAALDLIDRLLAFFEMYDRTYAAIEAKLYQAVVLYRLKKDDYEAVIKEVMEKANDIGFYHIISDHGAAVLPLIEKVRPETVDKKYYERLLRLTRQMAENYPNYLATAEDLKEPLTKTERRVLHLLCEGLNADEICRIMGISYSGIKFHNKNIYRKLEVNNRTEAVRKAFKLGLNETLYPDA